MRAGQIRRLNQRCLTVKRTAARTVARPERWTPDEDFDCCRPGVAGSSVVARAARGHCAPRLPRRRRSRRLIGQCAASALESAACRAAEATRPRARGEEITVASRSVEPGGRAPRRRARASRRRAGEARPPRRSTRCRARPGDAEWRASPRRSTSSRAASRSRARSRWPRWC